MTDVRLDRSEDGRCTLFIGRMLVFTDLSEVQARALARAFGGALAAEPARGPASQRYVGGRSGRTRPRSAGHAAEQALARLR